MTLHRRLPQLRLVAEVAMEMLEEKVKMEVWRPGSQVALVFNTINSENDRLSTKGTIRRLNYKTQINGKTIRPLCELPLVERIRESMNFLCKVFF